ncbi:MAG TPA: SUMF1/EgtB/PvdO family nonheme iron enzyme [Aggregatilineales bacterium]|nr:SUMF1/EgtB/PvdO family nonheme iron enzyme [Aggregatilineales bacterium]
MPKIFISYRRDDSADVTGRIHDWLTARIGGESIFRDVDDIPFGVDFKKYLEDTVSQCSVMLVVIGPQWLTVTDESGTRRLDDPRDFVRVEVETALKRDISVIPLLVNGANMPTEKVLPPNLANLAYRNGMAIRRDPDFRPDMDRLIQALEGPTGAKAVVASKQPTITPDNSAPFVLPMLEWCEVPTANMVVTTGITRVQAFRISKYPVTNAQYQAFIDAPDGYYDANWWNISATCRDWHRANPSAAAPQFDVATCPREMVNWYEAMAFCQWLSNKAHLTITLPTNHQWRLASQGPGRQDYPWGDGFDRTRCNTRESNIRQTTPVDRYKQGVSPYGLYDMLGNVWEWTLSEHDTGANTATSALPRTIRGGSWHDFQVNVSTAKRGSPVEERTGDLGFRIVTGALN